MRRTKRLLLLCLLLNCKILIAQTILHTDVLIIGGGASGTTAGIQSARMGVKTLIIEETNWLGGMLTSAGVSAIDGNHKMPAGLWGEFRQHLYDHYGGPASVETGWVSNTLFEPHVGNAILQKMVASEKDLHVWFNTQLFSIERKNSGWLVKINQGKKQRLIESRILIDATELGDVLAMTGAAYSVGMDSRKETGEEFAPELANNIIQDLTYVAVLKDYGKDADKTIPKPEGYDPAEFNCCCDVSDPASFDSPQNNCFRMMQYGKLPGNKYMINWPKCGNDIYLNIIEKTPAERALALQKAKLHTLRFIYYIQTTLGYKNLGLADDEFSTADKLPMIPYHRESRRVKGLTTFTLNHVADPYKARTPLFRTGIAVGDYTIDHHHLKNPSAPAIDFVKIKVPSYNIPMGSLIPANIPGLIVAEKSISVTNIVNGATRLQPVVLQIGQAAGLMAARCIQLNKQPAELDVRDIQTHLLNAKGYIMPFIDVAPSDPQFSVMQKIGATGILKGEGVPYLWANQTWFYPERNVSAYELVQGLREYFPSLQQHWGASGAPMDLQGFIGIMEVLKQPVTVNDATEELKRNNITLIKNNNRILLNRRSVAVLLDKFMDPFNKTVTITGAVK